MRVTAFLPNGAAVDLGAPLSARIDRDEQAPADAFEAVFPLGASGPFAHVEVKSGGQTIFEGIVDEEKRVVNSAGARLTIAARSWAALLLDSEALPQTLSRPSLPLLFERCALPYGFAGISGETGAFSQKYCIVKGTSEWQALADFCREYLRTGLYAQGWNLAAGERPAQRRLRLGRGGTPLLSAEESELPCRLLSELWVQEKGFSGYGKTLHDSATAARGVQRRLLLRETPGGQSAREKLERAQRDSFSLRVLCPGLVQAAVGDEALLREPLLEEFPLLRVGAVRWLCGAQGERTLLTLRKSGCS